MRKESIKNSKLVKVVIGIMLITAILSCIPILASATSDPNVISDIHLSHQVKIDDMTFGDVPCSSLGGIGINDSGTECFYALKASGYELDLTPPDRMQEQVANFFYFPNLSTMKTDKQNGNYGVYQIKFVGHANGMAVDDNNIYITGFVVNKQRDGGPGSNQVNNTYNNWIIMLPKTVVSQMASNGWNQNGNYIPKYNASTGTNGYRVLYPKIKNSSGSYVRYTKEITAITKFNTNGTFIINTEIDGIPESTGFQFVKAELKTINNTPEIVVSNLASDYFIIENTLSQTITTPQDICYKPSCGFFIPRFYGGNHKGKNVVAWADISSTASYVNVSGYKMYRPTKINLNKTNYKETNANGEYVLKYTRFEIESLAISQSNKLYAGIDIALTAAYAGPGNNRQMDGIYALTFDSPAKDFTLANKPPVDYQYVY